ncbi:regulator of G-protein signaling loco isoform X2 [Anopheles stephensi]|uniref:regulator of G-protein signaling loco isoform X2 n=1 Tax=Anopheles stephensi TaxID=30069 RepID=UPI001658A21B|nr:regulator of G-protein signaling loco isoform X2 [Anopheles stephensi]
MHAAGVSGGGGGGGGTGAAHRRRKKRSNYGNRTVEVNRGTNGFGFTISGQQPCILSCIVAGSPADLAGLRAGDFLISVNGLNVSKLPHESVVQLIGTTHGTIRMAIAENYYSDSSDEDILFHGAQQQRTRPKYPHKTKFSRAATQGTMVVNGAGMAGCSSNGAADRIMTHGATSPIKPLMLSGENVQEELSVNGNVSPQPGAAATAYNVIHSPNASNSCDISNVSAMVRSVQLGTGPCDDSTALVRAAGSAGQCPSQEGLLEYQAIVGYLGTIEMPKQIATSSKLQTVRSCIRKMRQEKRNPTTVLMTILPSCLNLTNTSNNLIAKYASARLSYVSSSSESDNKYFGLVTSAIYADGLMCDSADVLSHPRKDVVISNSCHVFVIDGKLVDHEVHLEKAALFRVVCTKDPITNLCLEFPSNSEYVVNLIRSMYSLKSPMKTDGGSTGGYGKPPVARNLNLDQAPGARGFPRNRSDPRLNPRAGMDIDAHDMLAANSPQPSNHSEITTTSSNSDSGIGFHNDCRNISDRILLVDFPGMLGPQQQRLLQQQQIANVRAHYRKSHPFLRPAGIINEIPPKMDPIRNIRSMGGAGCSPDGAIAGPSRAGLQIAHGKSKSADYSFPSSSASTPFVDRLTVRARPDPKPFSSDRSPSKENALNCMQDDGTQELAAIVQESDVDRWTCGRTLDEQGNVVEERAVDVPPMEELFLDLERYNNDNVKNSLLVARSCDDMILSLGKKPTRSLADGEEDAHDQMLLDAEAYERLKIKLSIDDLTLISSESSGLAPGGVHEERPTATSSVNQHVFLQPLKPVKRSKKACTTHTAKASSGKLAAIHGTPMGTEDSTPSSVHGRRSGDKMTAYKLSPKVFGLPRPISVSFENISTLSGTVGEDARDSTGGVDKLGVEEMYFDGDETVRSSANKSSRRTGSGTPGSGRKSRAAKRLSGGFSAIWGSLQELRSGSFGNHGGKEDRTKPDHGRSSTLDVCNGSGADGGALVTKQKERERRLSSTKILEATYSEPDLRYDEGKQINHNASPFRRWGQSSLRSRSTEHRTPTNGSSRRPSSLAASESDVYTKSIDDDYSSTKSGYNPYIGGVDTLSTESAAGVVATGGSTLGTAGSGGSTAPSTGPTGVASWGTSFEKLLEDAGGLHTFSEFLKKEFSAENIYFWTACERYRQLTEREERAREAQAIFARHLESGCSEPVNVDSIARNIALENLPQAEPTLFAAAQKQIFNLMKFDSYQRFIKSDMYRVCQEAEAKGQVLPYPGEQLDPMLRTSSTMATANGANAAGVTKLKKSLSNAEDRRRKSLLPWHRKTRCKSKDRGDSDASKKDSGKGTGSGGTGGGEKSSSGMATSGGGSSSNTLKLLSTNSTSDIHSSRSSLASFDAAIGGKSYDPDDSRNTLCRVILSNGATTVVQTRSNETIKELVERLLEKRGIVYNAYEAFLASGTKPLDLDGPSVSLAGKEVNIDQRVVFKLSLPNRKMISVKSKATKPLADVLRPILYKYNYELDQMKVVVQSTVDVFLDMTQPVTTVDGLCLHIRSANEPTGGPVHPELGRPLAGARPVINTATHQQIVHHFQQQQQQLLNSQPAALGTNQPQPPHPFVIPSSNPPSYAVATNTKSQQLFGSGTAASATCNTNMSQNQTRAKEQTESVKDEQTGPARPGQQELNTLDEITNKVFNELMNGKTASNGAVGKGPPDVDCTSDTSSTRRDRFRRRGSNAAPSESGRGAKSKKCSTGGSEDGGESVNNLGIKKPIIAKLKAGVKLQIPTRSQNDELLEGLKRAQRSRLEDQRGTEINFELPDFLKDKENFSSASTASLGNASTVAAAAAPSTAGPSKLTRSKPARRSEATTPTSEFVGGSLQQINKPQPAPRLSITGQGGRQNPSGPGSPVHAAVSDSHLNLSTQCNASPLPQDDPFHVHGGGGGSQSETSYADTTLVFTHARPYNGQPSVAATPRSTISSNSVSHHHGPGDHSSDSSTAADGDLTTLGCCEHHPHELSPDSSPPNHANHLHPMHYHTAGASGTPNSGSGAITSTTNPYPLVHYPSHNHHHHHVHPHHHPHGQHYHHHHHNHSAGTRYQTATPVANGLDGQTGASTADSQKGPPPLPPKPKILPMKPSNWGHPVAASYAPGPPGTSGNDVVPGSLTNGTTTAAGNSPNPSSTLSNHHGGVGTSPVAVGSNGITGSSTAAHSDGSAGGGGAIGREGNRRTSGGGTADSGSSSGTIHSASSASAISVAVAQARNVYFDQGNSSFV